MSAQGLKAVTICCALFITMTSAAVAVDVPALAHIVDCVMFPSRGQRPHPTEMAGGDLDGDQFFAVFDTTLHPTGSMRNMPAMDYIAPVPEEVDDMTDADLKLHVTAPLLHCCPADTCCLLPPHNDCAMRTMPCLTAAAAAAAAAASH
eukprot:17845-Heterococcus_DN1.PRE.6